MERKGIDISQHNVRMGKIDWSKVRASGVEFVMLRVGWAGYAGELHQDESLEESIIGAQRAGLAVGLYVYSYLSTKDAARQAARESAELALRYRVSYPIVLDVEDDLVVKKFSKAEITDTIIAFCEELQRLGCYAMYYTAKSYTESYLESERLTRYDFWLAQYAPKPTYSGAFGIWQYAGTEGRCEGVTGPCDRNLAYRDYDSIIKNAGLNGFSKPTVPTVPIVPPPPVLPPQGRSISVAQLRAQGYDSITL